MISFFAPGIPQTKGSARAFMPKGARFPVVTNDNPKNASWAGVVALAAREAMAGEPPLGGCVSVSFTFHLTRPANHFRTNGDVKPGTAPAPWKRPDWDKLAR